MLQPLNGLTGPVVNNQSYNNNSNEMGSFEKSGIQNSNKHTHPNPISGMFLINMLKFYLEESKNVTAQNEIVPTEHFESKF